MVRTPQAAVRSSAACPVVPVYPAFEGQIRVALSVDDFRRIPGSTMNAFLHAVLLATAGAAGTLVRAGCTAVATRLWGPAFPWGTLAVNVMGSFAFGAIWALARARHLPPGTDSILLVGLVGGFTTYSTFAFQSLDLLQTGRTAAAVAYVMATNVLGLAAVWAGLRCCR